MTLEQQYIKHVESCFEKAKKGESKISQEIIDMEGMSGTQTRHLYNNLASMDDARYLEIGVWKGSSTCSAMYGNKARVVCMDNWAGFGGPKDEFLENFAKYKGENDADFIEADCYSFDVSSVAERFNIYMFDGDHAEQSHFLGLNNYLPVMDDIFILVIDDWNWPAVRKGTQRAIGENNLDIIYYRQERTTDNDEFPSFQELASETFWNGVAVFVLKQQ